jgi:hypothetical protein
VQIEFYCEIPGSGEMAVQITAEFAERTHKHHDNRPLSWDLNPGHPKHEARWIHSNVKFDENVYIK